MWENFKIFITAEYHKLQEQNKVTSMQSIFHSTNEDVVEDISIVLENPVLAAMPSRDTT